MTAEIPAEMEFITNAVQPKPDVDQMDRLLESGLDWEQVLRAAIDHHKVGPLLYRTLRESELDATMPPETVETLRQHARQTATRNLTLTNSLFMVLDRFDEYGIPALPYKGPTLTQQVYGDFSLRPSRDLDVLVRPADLYDAEQVLRAEGFESDEPLTESQRRVLLETGRRRTLERNGVMIELHPRVSEIPDDPFEATELLKRRMSMTIAGRDVPTIAASDNLLVLCVHGTKHRWSQLKWIADIAYSLENGDFDVPTAQAEARQRGCYRRVLLGCALASSVLDVQLPPAVRREVTHLRDQRLYKETYPRCLFPGEFDDKLSRFRYRLGSQDDRALKAKYGLYKLTAPTTADVTAIEVPSHSLYYLVRPLRVARIGSAAAIQRLTSLVRSY